MGLITCSECGLEFTVPDSWQRRRRLDHKTFYCPNGDPQYYAPKDTEGRIKELEAELEKLKSKRDTNNKGVVVSMYQRMKEKYLVK